MESDASIDILERLKDITECCICSETLRNSRVLPCIHTFCLDCLRRTHSSFANAGNKLPCPICRSEFDIPSEGMDKLPRNFFIERVIEMTTTPGTTLQREEGRPTLCDACLDDNGGEADTNDIPPATMQCVECQQKLCDECCKHHRKNKMTRTHRIVALGEQVVEPTESEHRVNPVVCQTHLGKPLEIYCSTCQTVTCVKCYFEAHQSHKCSEVAIVVDELKKQVLTDIRKVSSWASEAKEKLKQLGNNKKEFLSTVDVLDAVISGRKEELKKLVETQAMALLSQLQTIKQRTIKEIENDKDSLERHIAILESYTVYCNAVSTSGTASDICLGANELHARAEKLLHLHESFDFSYSRVEKVILKIDEPDECLKSCRNIVGKLHVSYKSKQENECTIQVPEEHTTNNGSKEAVSTSNTKNSDTSSNAFSIRLLHRVTSHDQWAMSGITHLGNSIYILSSSSNSIFVHEDKEPFQKQRDIQTKSIKAPVDIASSQTSNCLYITDQKSSCLWKISPSKNDEISKCLLGIGEPYTLSVSTDGCVLMAKSGSPCSYLTTYSPGTDTVRSIELPVEVDGPQHAVRTSTGNVIVSYGKRAGKSWNLMEVTDSGQMVRRHEARDTFHQLNGSYHLAVDANDRVIVVDFYNNRVMLLDSKLNWARTLLTSDRHGINSPKRLCFVTHNNQLIVKNRKAVDIYSFQSSSQLHN